MVDLQWKSWIEYSSDTDFPIQNIPFGIVSINDKIGVASRIGDKVVLLAALAEKGLFNAITDLDQSVFSQSTLNAFIEQGKKITSQVRMQIAAFAKKENEQQYDAWAQDVLVDLDRCEIMMPLDIGDYTDFYSSIEHATNVGTMFRDPSNALLPNWKHLPVGYHGRASSIVVSGTDIHRPKGQMIPPDADTPVFGPCRLLDFELEMGFVIGKKTALSASIPVDEAEDYIFGMMLFNDWSARDIQKWEYVPLGPFLGKSFASTISPWIVTLEALEPFRYASEDQSPIPLPYLQQKNRSSFDLDLHAYILLESGEEVKISSTNFKYMYWTQAQQLAHHTVNGCNVNVGDVCASGTISGRDPGSYGSMLELSWKGTKPLPMPDGSERKFLKDGDTLILRGYGEKDGVRIGFGEARGKVLPAI